MDLDVTNSKSVETAVSTVISETDRIDVIVNNAGYTAFGITESFSDDDFQKLIEVNLKGPWRLISAVLPQLRRQEEGLIINISSGGARFSAPFSSMYCSTKFALEGLVEGMYYELKGLGIENILIQPGNFETGLQSKFATGSNPDVLNEYGEIAKLPEKMTESLIAYFQSNEAASPMLVAEAIEELIETGKGERPFRTVVDPTPMGTAIKNANDAVAEQYDSFLKAFGLA